MQIIAKQLKFTYNKKSKFPSVALNGVDLEISQGEFVGIVGHTGSGKSTFIQHINRLIEVQEGFLQVGEYNLSPQSRKEKKLLKKSVKDIRRGVGMVFQYPEYQLFAETVFEDVAFGIRRFMPNLSAKEVEELVKHALTRVGLDYEEYKNKSPFELSGGQKRRVAIAGVIATKPPLLVFDEPLAGLDPVGKTELMELLKALLGENGQTIVIISHDMDEVAENCSRVIVFDNGKVALDGTPKQVFSQVQKMESMRLECPVTANVSDALRKFGVEVDSDLTIKDFASKVARLIGGLK